MPHLGLSVIIWRPNIFTLSDGRFFPKSTPRTLLMIISTGRRIIYFLNLHFHVSPTNEARAPLNSIKMNEPWRGKWKRFDLYKLQSGLGICKTSKPPSLMKWVTNFSTHTRRAVLQHLYRLINNLRLRWIHQTIPKILERLLVSGQTASH